MCHLDDENEVISVKLIIPGIVLLYLNMLSFSLLKEDEVRARENARRIPEITLFLSAGLFGAAGGIIATHSLNHKNNPWSFRVFLPLMFALQAVAIVFAVYKWIL